MVKPCSPEAHAVAEANPRGLESEHEKAMWEIVERTAALGTSTAAILTSAIAKALDEAGRRGYEYGYQDGSSHAPINRKRGAK